MTTKEEEMENFYVNIHEAIWKAAKNQISSAWLAEILLDSACGVAYWAAADNRLNQECLEDMLESMEKFIRWHRDNCAYNMKKFNEINNGQSQ